MARAESLVSDVMSFYSFDGDGNDTTLTGFESKSAGNAGSRPSLVSSKSNRVSSLGSPQVKKAI
jgi:hypothetical protein